MLNTGQQRSAPSFLDTLAAVVGEGGVVTDVESMGRYCVDWSGDNRSRPVCVVLPRSVEQVQAVIKLCGNCNLAVVPQGGNTGLVAGAMADCPDPHVVVALERLNSIRNLSEADFAITVDAGCILQTVKDACDSHNLIFPLAIGAQGTCQVGGNAATNAGGINVLRYGMMRDQVLGLEVVLPDGSLWSNMSGLRKDNRGYDLKQLFIGSEGTLGIITGLVLKLFPKPAKTETAYIALDSFDDSMALFLKARHFCSDLLTAFEIIGSECIDLARIIYPDLVVPFGRNAPVHVLMEVSAGETIDVRSMVESLLQQAMETELITDAVLAESLQQARSFWSVREGLVEGQARRGYHVRTDLSVRLSSVATLIAKCRDCIQQNFPDWIPQAYGHAGDGNIHFNVLPPLDMSDPEARAIGKIIEARLFAIATSLGGSISAEHGIGRTKVAAFLRGISPSHSTIIQNIKAAMDPTGLMNPGCIFNES